MAAHHLETITIADRVVFLHEGRLRGEGTHEHLLTTSPLYRDVLAAEARQSFRARSGPEIIAEEEVTANV